MPSKLRKPRQILASLALLLGAAHIVAGFIFYPEYNLESFWFLGFGLAIILTALANFRQDNIWILRAQNALMLGFITALFFLAPQPQVMLGCALFAGLFLISCKTQHKV